MTNEATTDLVSEQDGRGSDNAVPGADTSRSEAPTPSLSSAPTSEAPTRLEFGELIIDNDRREAWLRGELIELTGAEFDLLWLLASNAGRILSREEIFIALRGIEYDGQDRSIDVRISRIRPKIGDDPDLPRLIKTVRSKGYLFVSPGPDQP